MREPPLPETRAFVDEIVEGMEPRKQHVIGIIKTAFIVRAVEIESTSPGSVALELVSTGEIVAPYRDTPQGASPAADSTMADSPECWHCGLLTERCTKYTTARGTSRFTCDQCCATEHSLSAGHGCEKCGRPPSPDEDAEPPAAGDSNVQNLIDAAEAAGSGRPKDMMRLHRELHGIECGCGWLTVSGTTEPSRFRWKDRNLPPESRPTDDAPNPEARQSGSLRNLHNYFDSLRNLHDAVHRAWNEVGMRLAASAKREASADNAGGWHPPYSVEALTVARKAIITLCCQDDDAIHAGTRRDEVGSDLPENPKPQAPEARTTDPEPAADVPSVDVLDLLDQAAETEDRLRAACEACAEGLERDSRLYPDGHFPNVTRFENRAAALRAALKAPDAKPEAGPWRWMCKCGHINRALVAECKQCGTPTAKRDEVGSALPENPKPQADGTQQPPATADIRRIINPPYPLEALTTARLAIINLWLGISDLSRTSCKDTMQLLNDAIKAGEDEPAAGATDPESNNEGADHADHAGT